MENKWNKKSEVIVPVLNRDNVQVVKRERILDSFFKVDAITVDHDCFNGQRLHNIRREVIQRADTVSVLLYDPHHDLLLFVRQIRVPLLDRQDRESPWTIEIIAGTIDWQASPEQVAYTEVKEEAGINLNSLIPIYSYFPSTGSDSGKMHFYLGLCDLSNAGGYFGLEEEGEDIEAFVVSRERAFEMLDEGVLDNGFTMIALLWLRLHYRDYIKMDTNCGC